MTGPGAECDGLNHRLRYVGRSHDAPIDCEQPILLGCLCGYRISQRCDRCSADKCRSCADRFRRRLYHVLLSGTDCTPNETLLLLTLTVPGTAPHALKDGTPCPCTPLGGIVVAEENALFNTRFNRLVQDLRRRQDPTLQYARVAELQERGALHYHVILRLQRTAADALLAGYRKADPYCQLRERVEHYGFGHEVDLRPADRASVGYLLKYVTKAASERATMPWLDLRTGEIISGNDRYRVWQASRHWGLKMRDVRAAQRAWAQENDPSERPPEDPQPPQAAAVPRGVVGMRASA